MGLRHGFPLGEDRKDAVTILAADLAMPFDKIDFESITEERRQSIKKSIRPISVDELKKIGNELFKYADDPWREVYFKFINEHPNGTFHHALTMDGVNIVYCSDIDKGVWFLPGQGVGPLQERGRQAMKNSIGAHG